MVIEKENNMHKYWCRSVIFFLSFVSAMTQAGDGKLIGTAGLNQLEGSGGGGIVPWATLAGYDSQEQISVNAFTTQVDIDDYRLNVLGFSASLLPKLDSTR